MSPGLAPIIGIVGGVGSGKSTLASALARHWRIHVLDADAAGHAALEQPHIQSELRTAFGDGIFNDQGAVVRPQLARLVFGDQPEQMTARHRLEAIVHPVIRTRLQHELATLRTSGTCDLIVLDAPIMLEAGWNELCDVVVFVDVPREQRIERVGRSRGWSAEELARREASQWPLPRKREAADYVVRNDGDVEQSVRALVDELQRRFPALKSRTSPDTPAAPLLLTS